MAHRTVNASEIEPLNGVIRLVRKALGVRAFGINQFDLPPGSSGKEHDEAESHQEEVYLVLAGSGTMTVDGEEVELEPGRYVYVSPDATRVLTAGPDGLSWVVVGAPAHHPYEPRGFF